MEPQEFDITTREAPFLTYDRKKKRKRLLFPAVCLLAAALLIGGGLYVCADVFGFWQKNQEYSFETVNQGSGAEVAAKLKEGKVVQSATIFEVYMGLARKDFQYTNGEYKVNANMSYAQIAGALKKPVVDHTPVKTIVPEGKNVVEIGAILEKNGVCSQADFLEAVNATDYDYDFLKEIPNEEKRVYRLEGYLFPATYQFGKNSQAHDIVDKMLKTFDQRFTSAMRERAREKNISLGDAVTLASIVQAEAPGTDTMKMVASIYWNRLKNPTQFPRLQADPTSGYARKVVTAANSDPAAADAYNTYKCTGLPAGPINNPGTEAIQAVLDPAESEYYFFCTNLDTGEFFHAKTLQEHEANLKKAGLR